MINNDDRAPVEIDERNAPLPILAPAPLSGASRSLQRACALYLTVMSLLSYSAVLFSIEVNSKKARFQLLFNYKMEALEINLPHSSFQSSSTLSATPTETKAPVFLVPSSELFFIYSYAFLITAAMMLAGANYILPAFLNLDNGYNINSRFYRFTPKVSLPYVMVLVSYILTELLIAMLYLSPDYDRRVTRPEALAEQIHLNHPDFRLYFEVGKVSSMLYLFDFWMRKALYCAFNFIVLLLSDKLFCQACLYLKAYTPFIYNTESSQNHQEAVPAEEEQAEHLLRNRTTPFQDGLNADGPTDDASVIAGLQASE